MDKEIAVITSFWDKQEKYTYYLIGLSVTAIGFVIVNTKGDPLMWTHLPVGLSIISWGISIFTGLRFLQYTISNLYANKGLLDVEKGKHPKTGTNPEKIKIAISGIREALENNSKAMERLGAARNISFYLGIVFYLIWHVVEMYNNI